MALSAAVIVDGNRGDRNRLALELERLGLTVATFAESPDPAHVQLPPADLVIADPGAAEQVGLLQRLIAAFPRAQMVLLTSYPSIQAGFAAGRAGAHAYLMKPMGAREILLAAEGHLGGQPTPGVASLERRRREHIEWVMGLCNGNKTRAARALDIPRYSLQRILARFPPPR